MIPIVPPKPEQESPVQMTMKGKVTEAYTAYIEKEISVAEGDEVTIIEHDKEGWTKVKLNSTGVIGLIPTSIVSKSSARDRSQSIRTAGPGSMNVKAIYGKTAINIRLHRH